MVGQACENKKGEFGNSILLSDTATAEKLAAEKLAAERLAAERLDLTKKSTGIVGQLNAAHATSSYPSYVRLFSPY